MIRYTRLAAAPLLAAPLLFAAPAIAQVNPTAQATNQPVNRIVVFGDSLADGGFFLTLLPTVPRDAGSFTTNPDPVAPEVLAARLGLTLTPVYGQGGTNYAVGGARVTAANGFAIPITTQISNFIAAGGTFSATDLVYIQGGGNDYFAFQAGGSRDNTILTTAANQLAAQVVRVQGLGAQRIVTMAVQTGGAAGLQLYNQTYAAALGAARVNALYFDTDKLFNEIVANAASFGITNTTGVACTVSSSLNCNRSTLVSPNANETYVLADSVHPSGIVQRIQGQAIASLVKAPEQIAGLAYAGQALLRSQRDLLEAPERGAAHRDGKPIAVFGSAAYHYYASGTTDQRTGVAQRAFSGMIGADLALGASSGVGIAGGYTEGSGDFTLGAGDYRVRAYTASGYARAGIGPLRLLADGTYGDIRYPRITRRVILGPTFRDNRGKTDGDYVAARGTAAVDLFTAGGVGVGPDLSGQYERLTIDGYAEDAATSTNAAFGRQRLKSVTGRASLLVRSLPGSPVGFFARAGYEREFSDDPHTIVLTPAGAPISYTSAVARADRSYMSYAMGFDGQVASALSLRAGVSGYALRDDRNTVNAYAGLAVAF